MFVVIFTATIKQTDQAYIDTANHLRDLALNQFNCIEFSSVSDGTQEISLSYWPDEDSIKQWKQHTDHLMAQKLGREKWYSTYSVTIAEVARAYQHPKPV